MRIPSTWIVAGLLAAAGTPLAGQGTPRGLPSPAPVQNATPASAGDTLNDVQARISAVAAQLEALRAELAGLQAQLAAARESLRELLAARPAAPGAGASTEQTTAYRKALADWDASVAARQSQIASLQAAIANKQKEIAARQNELAQLQQARPAVRKRAG